MAKVTGHSRKYIDHVWATVNGAFCVDEKRSRFVNVRQESQKVSQIEFREKCKDAISSRWNKRTGAVGTNNEPITDLDRSVIRPLYSASAIKPL